MVEITESQARLARFWVAEAVNRRLLLGQPVTLAPVHELLATLSSTGGGTEMVSTTTESEPGDDLIGTREAATILGCSARYIRKIATDLDGTRCGNSWTFHRDTVETYAHAKQPRRQTNGNTDRSDRLPDPRRQAVA